VSIPLFAGLATDDALHLVADVGVTGNTTADYLARFDTDVTPHAPDLVSFGSATNNIRNGLTLAAYQADIATLIAKTRAIGATPLLRTTTPMASTNGATARLWNSWLRAYAARNGILITDSYAASVDPATGALLSAFDSGDHVHPNAGGYRAAGLRLASDLTGWTPPISIPVLRDAVDAGNVMVSDNPLFLNTTLTNQAPPRWTCSNPAETVSTMITNDVTISGNWWRIAVSNNVTQVTIYPATWNYGITVGHVYALTGKIKTALTASGGVSLHCSGSTPETYSPLNFSGPNITYSGRFWVAFTATATTSHWELDIPAGTTGTIDLAEMALFDLTAMGINTLLV
jgi:lysophospholipase L1-like esterase